MVDGSDIPRCVRGFIVILFGLDVEDRGFILLTVEQLQQARGKVEHDW
jgi:hypothetical protein